MCACFNVKNIITQIIINFNHNKGLLPNYSHLVCFQTCYQMKKNQEFSQQNYQPHLHKPDFLFFFLCFPC